MKLFNGPGSKLLLPRLRTQPRPCQACKTTDSHQAECRMSRWSIVGDYAVNEARDPEKVAKADTCPRLS